MSRATLTCVLWAASLTLVLPARSQEGMSGLMPRAQAGEAEAQFQVGELLYAGRGVVEDRGKAARWYERAALQGHSGAQRALGYMLLVGECGPPDPASGLRWLRHAATQGDATAAANLGTCYERGRGVTADPGQALRWYRRASQLGLARGRRSLAQLLAEGAEGVPADPYLAYALCLHEALAGDAAAQNTVGRFVMDGTGVSADPARAVAWYRKAAAQGHALAQYNLAGCLSLGIGAPEDREGAIELYYQAASQGLTAALEELNELDQPLLLVDPVRLSAECLAPGAQLKIETSFEVLGAPGGGAEVSYSLRVATGQATLLAPPPVLIRVPQDLPVTRSERIEVARVSGDYRVEVELVYGRHRVTRIQRFRIE